MGPGFIRVRRLHVPLLILYARMVSFIIISSLVEIWDLILARPFIKDTDSLPRSYVRSIWWEMIMSGCLFDYSPYHRARFYSC